MKKLLFFNLFILNTLILCSQSLIALEGLGGTSFYSSLPDALEAAVDGDIIYLPGGSFSLGEAVGGFNIDKQIQIIGAGYNVDSSQATQITTLDGTIYFADGSSGSSLSGVYCTGDVYFGSSGFGVYADLSEIFINRCNFNMIFLGLSGTNTIENVLINESIFRSTGQNINVGVAINVLVSKCVFNGWIQGFDELTTFSNCIFLGNTSSYIFSSVQNTIIQNCIFLKNSNSQFSSPETNLFYNNIFVYANPNMAVDGSNFLGIPQAAIFMDQSGYAYNPEHNYNLQDDCVGVDAGNDGTDIGIYGSMSPFKDGAMPINPHIQLKSIGTTTNAEGDLEINIKVAAQDN